MEKRISFDDIIGMARLPRINFVNTLPGMKGACLVGTRGHRGVENLALFNSVVHISAKPPMLGFVIRPLTVPRHTYHHIKASKVFTINLVHEGILEAAHHSSANYPAEVSEFERCGLTPAYTDTLAAPYVAECKVKIGLRLEEEVPIRANDSLLMIGTVLEVLLPEDAVLDSGHVTHETLGTVAVSGLDTYYRPSLLQRLGYARPKADDS